MENAVFASEEPALPLETPGSASPLGTCRDKNIGQVFSRAPCRQIAEFCNSSFGDKPGTGPVWLNQISTGGTLHLIPAWRPGSLLVPGNPGFWWRKESVGKFCPRFARSSPRLSHERCRGLQLPALVASSSRHSLALSQLFASSLPLSPVACCTLEKLKAAVKGGFAGSKAPADPLGSCYACSTLGHTSGENKSCPLSMQTNRFMPGANLTWGPQKRSVDSGKPSPVRSPIDSPMGAGKTPFSSYKSPLVIPSALQNHGALLLLGGTQPKQQRHLVTWDFHVELPAKAGMSHQRWRDSPGRGAGATGAPQPAWGA